MTNLTNGSESEPVFNPVAGMRFTYNGSEFEIAHVAYNDLRYNAVAGGRSFRMPVVQLLEQIKEGRIVITSESQAIAQSPYLTLSTDGLKQRLRQLRYAQGAVAELSKPTAKAGLREWVVSYAKKLGDETVPGISSVARWIKALRDFGEEYFLNRPPRQGNWTLRFGAGVESAIQDGLSDFMRTEKRSTQSVLAHVHGYLLEHNIYAKRTPCTRTLRRRVNKIDPYLLTRIKQGPIEAERAARAGGRANTSHLPMFCVQIDSHKLDLLVVDQDTGEVMGRPTLVLGIDVRTRCIVGWHLSMNPPSATTTLAAVKDMFSRPMRGLPGGIPVHLIPDNGVEFKNTPVIRLLLKAGVIIEPAAIREPNHKPHVESFFRTFTTKLIHSMPGTTFSNPTERGRYPSEKRACLTIDQVRSYVETWIEEVYHMTVHSSTGRAPIMMWREETGEGKCKVLAMTEDEVAVIARTPIRCTINRGRIRYDGLIYFSHALRTIEHTYKGKVVVLIDELDLSRVYVEHPTQKGSHIVAESTTPEYTEGLTKWAHQEAKKILSGLSERDRRELGESAPLYALHALMKRIQKDSEFAMKQMKRLREGKKQLDKRAEEAEAAMAASSIVLSSRINDLAGKPSTSEWIDPETGEILTDQSPQSTDGDASKRNVANDLNVTILD